MIIYLCNFLLEKLQFLSHNFFQNHLTLSLSYNHSEYKAIKRSINTFDRYASSSIVTVLSFLLKQEIGCILSTVNSEIFARVLFSRNFAYAKFGENKNLAKCRNQSVIN